MLDMAGECLGELHCTVASEKKNRSVIGSHHISNSAAPTANNTENSNHIIVGISAHKVILEMLNTYPSLSPALPIFIFSLSVPFSYCPFLLGC